MKKTFLFMAVFAVCGSQLFASEGCSTPPATGIFSKVTNGVKACGNFVYPTRLANCISNSAAKYPLTTFAVSGVVAYAAVQGADWVYKQIKEEEDSFEFETEE